MNVHQHNTNDRQRVRALDVLFFYVWTLTSIAVMVGPRQTPIPDQATVPDVDSGLQ
jgi:hypothetical protein